MLGFLQAKHGGVLSFPYFCFLYISSILKIFPLFLYLKQMVFYRQFYLSALLIAQTIPLNAATLMLE